MTRRLESAASTPEAAKPRFSIDSILRAPRPVQTGLQWIPVKVPGTMVQNSSKPAPCNPSPQQQSNQYLFQVLLQHSGLPCPTYPSIMALGGQQQFPHQQGVLVSPPPPCSSTSTSHQFLPGLGRSSVLIGPSSAAIPGPIPHHPQQTMQQQSQLATATARQTSAAVIMQGPSKLKLLPLKERRKKRSPPELLAMEAEGSECSRSPRSRENSTCSADISSDSGDEMMERVRDSAGAATTTAVTANKNLHPCTRLPSPPLSGSSPSPPPVGAGSSSQHHREVPFKKSRTSFSKTQIQKLEDKFCQQKYLTKLDRTHLAKVIGLTEKHVKTWFQNRRTKWKKECSDTDWSRHKEIAATLMYNQYLEAKSKTVTHEDERIDEEDS